jgi:hypothetical protein
MLEGQTAPPASVCIPQLWFLLCCAEYTQGPHRRERSRHLLPLISSIIQHCLSTTCRYSTLQTSLPSGPKQLAIEYASQVAARFSVRSQLSCPTACLNSEITSSPLTCSAEV